MTYLNIDQRAVIVGDQGICPECEREIEWADIDSNWYLCNDCVEDLIARGPVEVAMLKLRDFNGR